MNGENDSSATPPQKSYKKILEEEVDAGLKELERQPFGLLISSFAAGLEVSFSLLLMGVMLTMMRGSGSHPATEILVAMMYSIGFILVIVGRSELFTEHTTRAVYPVLTGHASTTSLMRLWGIIFAGNVIGTALFARFVDFIGPALGVIDITSLAALGHRVATHPWWVLFLSGILAGWLMGLLSWLVTASRDTISQVFLVWLITSSIGLCHLHHAIVGSAEVLASVFSGSGVTLQGYGWFLLWASIGNIAGGVFFVALLKFSHVIRGGKESAHVSLDSGE